MSCLRSSTDKVKGHLVEKQNAQESIHVRSICGNTMLSFQFPSGVSVVARGITA